MKGWPAMVAWLRGLERETREVLREIAHSRSLRTGALFLLPYAGVLVGLDVAAHYGEITEAHLPVQFFLSQDRSFGEYLEYSLTFAVATLLFLMWRARGSLAYLANAILFFWLTLDNAFEVHERFGHWAAPAFVGWPVPVDANHLAEAGLFLAIGVIWATGLWGALRVARPRAAVHSLILAGCIGVTAFFGIVVDLLVVWGEQSPALHEFATFIEDGGEFAMICIAFLLTVAIFDIEKKRWSLAAEADPGIPTS